MGRSNNLPAKIYKAGERTVTRLHYKWAVPSGDAGAVYIDIAKSLSQVNRRAYRQGLYYYVAGASFSNSSAAYCQINTIMDNWCTKLAWLRGFRQWSKMNAIAAQADNVIYPKYHDFKVAMHGSDSAVLSSTLNVAYGNVTSSSTYLSDDWVQSDFVSADPSDADDNDAARDVFRAHMIGPHVTASTHDHTSIGLIASLNDVWSREPSAGEPELDGDADTDPIANLFDYADIHDDIRQNLMDDNDEPPYDHDLMPGANNSDEQTSAAIMRVSSGAGAYSRAPGFCAPFGLLEVYVTDFGGPGDAAGDGDVGNVELILDMVPGSYHGVHAERVI